MNQFVLSLVSGIASGAVYGLMGLGLVIIYRSTDVVNFAVASMALAAMYLAASLHGAGVAVALALLIGVVGAGVGGVVAREVVLRPLKPGQLFSALVITMGLSLIVDDVTRRIWGGEPRTFPLLVSGQLRVAGTAIQYQQLLTIAVAALAMLASPPVQADPAGRGDAGRRRVQRHRDAAGDRPQRVARVAWAPRHGPRRPGGRPGTRRLSGLAIGVLQPLLFRAFAGIFLGGLTSMYGAVIGGLIDRCARQPGRELRVGQLPRHLRVRAGDRSSCWSGRRACSASERSRGSE